MIRTPPLLDVRLAAVLVLIGATSSWALALGLPLIGIDDAAITRSYAENIANGFGYVYNIGGERVEGATAILWVSILTVLYRLTDSPEVLIIVICACFSVAAIFFTLRLTRLICTRLTCESRPAIWILSVFLAANPGYFMWSVWTMMEVGLWSMVLIGMVYLLTQLTASEGQKSPLFGICLAALLMPLARPEGVLIALGLIVLTGMLVPRHWRVAVIAAACSVGSFLAVTAFRLSYFGHPFPNTFYAKVSSDRLQDMKDGVKYLLDFMLGSPFVEVFVAIWLGAVIWALLSLRKPASAARPVLITAAATLGILAVYASLGGDHFALWRFYQPVFPLLVVGLAVVGAVVAQPLNRIEHQKLVSPANLAIFTSISFVIFIGWLHYYQTRFHVIKEFKLVERGLGFGEFLNDVSPQPIIGVGPAGGIALAYDGKILDLLGLNWTEMAHANPIKVGMRNHASFDAPTFWKHAPDVLSAFNRACKIGEPLSFWASNDSGFGGLFSNPLFQQSYVPISFHSDTECWPGFAKLSWLESNSDSEGMDVFDWSEIKTLH